LRAVTRPDHAPAADDVVVRTVVAGVNRADLFIRSGEWPISAGFPYVPGLEVAGVVERAGSDVTDFAPGDGVITMMQRLGGIHGTRAGGYQSHVLVPASTLVKLPPSLDPAAAGALGLAAVTAHLGLAALDVRAGQRVLVQGGSSGVGSMALQMLRAAGIEAIATGTRPGKFDAMRSSGAAACVDTRTSGWSKHIGRIERVFDLVGRATFAESVAALSPGGRLVFVGGTSGGELAFSGWDLMKPVALTGYSTETLTRDELERSIGGIAAMHAAGSLRVENLSEFRLADAAAAHRAMEAGEITGRVVLRA
jgi:NADPH2:quinone reductase